MSELKACLGLLAADVMREAYATASPTRVKFVPDTQDKAQVEHSLATLPPVTAGLFRFELIEVKPFANDTWT